MINKDYGIFETRKYNVRAYILTETETIIDNDVKMVGLPGDYKVFDEGGDIFFMTKEIFIKTYRPIDIEALDMVGHSF